MIEIRKKPIIQYYQPTAKCTFEFKPTTDETIASERHFCLMKDFAVSSKCLMTGKRQLDASLLDSNNYYIGHKRGLQMCVKQLGNFSN